MQDDAFEWDDVKAAANLAKHGVAFEDARQVFQDAKWLELNQDSHAGETRYNNLGMVNGVVLHVTVTDADDGRYRIVSARRATRNERRKYEEQGRH